MLLCEAKDEIDSRIKHYHSSDLTDIIELKPYIEALEIASLAIQAQMDLADVLNDINSSDYHNDSYSGCLVYEILEGLTVSKIKGKE